MMKDEEREDDDKSILSFNYNVLDYIEALL